MLKLYNGGGKALLLREAKVLACYFWEGYRIGRRGGVAILHIPNSGRRLAF